MVHGKQFAILPQPIALEGYLNRPLSDGMILSYHRDLPVTVSPDTETILLGHAWNAYADGEDPASAVARLRDEKELLEAECAWCGRYVVVFHGIVYTDVTASMPVFYADEGVTGDIRFLADLDSHPRNGLELADKVKWFPGPTTAFEGIRRLLPSQSYDYRKKKTAFRNPLSSRVPDGKTYEELRASIFRALVSSTINMHRHFKDQRLIVALTGGYDSRLSFAALQHVSREYPFSAYTMEHDHLSKEDSENPPLLCKMVNVPFYYGKRDSCRFSKERDRAYREHLSGMVMEEDQRFYAYGQYDGLLSPGEKGVLIRSNFFTLAYASIAQQRAVGNEVNISDFFSNYEISPHSPAAKAFSAFFDWTKQHPLPISDTNRFYWEQKLACWSAENDRGYDIYDRLTPIQMGNCRDLATMLLKIPPENKIGKKHQADLINMLCPEIASVPYSAIKSGASGMFAKGLEAVGKAWKKARKIGFTRTAQYYFSKVFSHKK